MLISLTGLVFSLTPMINNKKAKAQNIDRKTLGRNLYEIERFPGSERHEVFEGRTGNREKSIEDGLVIFLTPERHRTSSGAIHVDRKFSDKVQMIA